MPDGTTPAAPAPAGRPDPARTTTARPPAADKPGAAGENALSDDLAPPGFHIYRPSSASKGNGNGSHDELNP
jgi:hypothetical protein